MRVYLGSDHAGFELKGALIAHLRANGHEAIDFGPEHYDATDDYPPFCFVAAQKVVADPGSLGVVLGGSGNGEQIAANKVAGVRCALAYNVDTARLAREHNDANLIGLGARTQSQDEAFAIVDAFLTTPFSGEPRHVRRIAMITSYEEKASAQR
jgi:ribose 5-phosphate isomerase B